MTQEAPVRTVVSRRPRRTPTLPSLALAALVAVAAVAVHRATGRYWGDLTVYRAGALAAIAGDGRVYGVVLHDVVQGMDMPFTYPPFAALLLAPLAWMGMDAAIAVWTFCTVLALAAVVWVTLGLLGRIGHRPALTVAGTVLALPTFPVSGHLQAGQVGLFLMLAVLLDLTGAGERRWRGVGVGVAAGIKLTPLIFVVYLLVTRRFRAAATSTAVFLATVAIGYAWRPADSSRFWSGAFADASRVATDPRMICDQSLRAALARLTDSASPDTLVWLTTAAVAGAGGLAVAVWATRSGEPLLGLLACGITGVLVSPVSWHHHWVWAVPALMLLADRAWRAHSRTGLAVAGLVWLAFVLSTSFALARIQGWDLHFHGWMLVYSNLYVLLGLAALAAVPFHLRAPR
jgi:alpha-1,2-mannosyltransferase